MIAFLFEAPLLLALSAASPVVDHDASVRLDVPAGIVEIDDTIALPPALAGATVGLLVHAGMAPVVDGVAHKGTALASGAADDVAVPAEVVWLLAGKPRVALHLRGKVVHPPQQEAREYQRSFQETPGTVQPEGVYLSPACLWLARVVVKGDNGAVRPLSELVTARVSVAGLPAGWSALTEGDDGSGGPGSAGKASTSTSTFTIATPSDGVHLVAGQFTITRERARGVSVETWLRSTDDALAQRYLEVTGQYLALYDELLGDYPYTKFALVENFWETGYGMPSFTLLGPQVIRFPFILHTSYPHELLHNWWGNGVFVDGGNWSEGLTAYLADHLSAEQQGTGVDYRRSTLARYQDYVGADPTLDFPLSSFLGRYSAASEAIGYGKWMMVVHMLRRRVGDAAFVDGLRRFYRDHRFDRARFDDLRVAFEQASKDDLRGFFEAWIGQAGAPTLAWRSVGEQRDKSGKRALVVELEQTQPGPAFPLDVPIVITTADGRGLQASVRMTDKRARASIPVPAAVARVDVDPFVDLFRTLLPGEVAPSMSRALGAKRMMFVVPTVASQEERAAWRRFAASLCGDSEAERGARCVVVDDKAVGELPADRAVFVLGYGNALRAGAVAVAQFDARFDDHGFLPPGPYTYERLKNERTNPGKTSVVLAAPHPNNDALAMTFVFAHSAAAVDKLAKKIPHYGKYGYLGFSGDAVDNTLKGQWQPQRAPLTVTFGSGARVPIALSPPGALRKLPPPLSPERMLALVKQLAQDKLRGRGLGDKGLDDAQQLVLQALKEAGAANAERQCLDVPAGKPAQQVCNLVAVLAGKNASLPPVVLAAHLDHLGVQKGRTFPGADDNASGVAALVEVARALVRAGRGERAVILLVTSGEESGLVGARAFVAAGRAKQGPAPMAMINLDTVGRKGDRPLLVLDGDTASEWVHIFRGIGFTTGEKIELGKEGGGASDQRAFFEAGVPAVQLFGGTHADYHKPSDTADKVEGASLVSAAVVAKEAVLYLRDRKEPLSATGGGAAASSSAERKAALGTVPDMTFGGAGVRVDDVVAGSPAAAVGLQKGDVLVRFDGKPVAGLREYSELLKQKKPGDKVAIAILRDGKELSLDVTLAAR